jgi:para-nitrobenzyl esterase
MHKLLVGVAVAMVAMGCAGPWATPSPPWIGQDALPDNAESKDDAVVQLDSGAVRGVVADDYRLFQGIPFARPPVGELRWQSPREPDKWAGVRDATKSGSPCAQLPPGGAEPGGAEASGPAAQGGSEDCLYLNVTTPRTTQHGLKPVIVWLHGGGLSTGSANDDDARRLARSGDVVVVSPEYRLSVFGFFGHPGLDGSGGFGLEDQQAALRWVKRNAAAFGGDPERVTLMGISGGANAVCMHLTAPASRGLFERAFLQSGSCSMTIHPNGFQLNDPGGGPLVSLADAERRGATVAATVGCADPGTAIACLRTKSPTELLTSWQGATIQTPAAFGGRVLPTDPRIALARGDFHRVPVVTGTTRDESTVNSYSLPQPFTDERYRSLLDESFGAQAEPIAAAYPSSGYASPAQAWSTVATDRIWACPQLTDAQSLARWTPTYMYSFADQNAPHGYFQFPDGVPSGAFHSSDLAYYFDVAGFEATFTPDQERLIQEMIGYLSRFAMTGDPNGANLPRWEPLHGSNAQSLAPAAIEQVDVAAEHNCAFWAGL